MKILVTGAAGFIGYHVANALLVRGEHVLGLDSLSSYYDVRLKEARLTRLRRLEGFSFRRVDLADRPELSAAFADYSPERVVHLAAQPGVRHSLENPAAYVNSNLVGFANILEECRYAHVDHLVYASSSSVYGANKKVPFSVDDNVDHPISLYAATKKANELMAHTYSHLFRLPSTGLRFFTVYGPWGRPDMAPVLFVSAILEERPIDVFNYGDMKRDFTYIDDIVDGVIRVLDKPPQTQPIVGPKASSGTSAPYKIYNIGNNRPVALMDFIDLLEACVGKKAKKNFLPMQPGDLPVTCADIDDLAREIGFRPSTPLEIGIPLFVQWYRGYYDKLEKIPGVFSSRTDPKAIDARS
jgi:UDP-glucuronate 4-epimerase